MSSFPTEKLSPFKFWCDQSSKISFSFKIHSLDFLYITFFLSSSKWFIMDTSGTRHILLTVYVKKASCQKAS